MKVWKTLTATTAVALVGFALTLAHAEGDAPSKGDGKRGGARAAGGGPMMDNLLPPRLVGDLNLSAEQKAKYDSLQASFKKEAAAWESAHPGFNESLRKAREGEDKEAGRKLLEQRKPLMEARKGYVDQLRATLSDEQKAKIEKAQENRSRMGGKGPRGEKGERKGPKPPPAE